MFGKINADDFFGAFNNGNLDAFINAQTKIEMSEDKDKIVIAPDAPINTSVFEEIPFEMIIKN